MKFYQLAPLALAYLEQAKADAPVNCMVTDFWGDWTFNKGLQGTKDAVTTGTGYHNLGDVTATQSFNFGPENQVTNTQTGSQGTVTFIYNQGFEFIIDNQMYWVNFYFDANGYSCTKTSVGYVHDKQGRNWARIQGTQDGASLSLQPYPENYFGEDLNNSIDMVAARSRNFEVNFDLLEKINQKTNGYWNAGPNFEDEKYTISELNLRGGVQAPSEMRPKIDLDRNSEKLEEIVSKAMAMNVVNQQKLREKGLPENLDWRNKDGQNFVSPVDDQGGCGSCYAFASAGLLEARARVQTNNVQQPIFSEQEIITCGKDKTYNQGCAGGFAYLTAGKYAMDFGFIEESCAPYHPADRTCRSQDYENCQRWYSTSYGYVGGYYGATTNDGGLAMMEAMQNGPLAVGFEVLDDFRSYKNGVYVHTGVKDTFNPFVPVNHAVLAVGYGVCDGSDPNCAGAAAGTPYWIVKNSWGTGFGMDGYFYILRGTDEVGIESIPVEATVLPQL